MAGNHPHPVSLDATVLSNSASTDSIGFLVSILELPAVVPAVRDEIERGHRFGHDFLATAVEAFDDGLPISDVPSETVTVQLRDRLDPGEADAFRGAVEHDGTVATDDLAARRRADELNIPVTGSIGLLVVGIEHGRVDRETADEWLETWRDGRGYYSPVESVGERSDEEERREISE